MHIDYYSKYSDFKFSCSKFYLENVKNRCDFIVLKIQSIINRIINKIVFVVETKLQLKIFKKKEKLLKDQSKLIKCILAIGTDTIGVKKMEVLWSVPDQMLKTTKEEVNNSLAKVSEQVLSFDSRMSYMAALESMRVDEYLQKIYIPHAAAGSCGNTTNILEAFVKSENQQFDPMMQVNDPLQFAKILKDQIDTNPNGHWYCRIDTGGHSVLVEFNNGYFMVHQSFFGRYTLADNVERNKTFSIAKFIQLIEVALSHNPIDETGKPGPLSTKEQTAARRELFNSQAVHPEEILYRFTTKSISSETLHQRVIELNQKGEKAWESYKSKLMGEFLIGKFSHEDQTQVTYKKNGESGSIADLIKFKSILDEEGMLVTHVGQCEVGSDYYLKRFGVTKLYKLTAIQDETYTFELFKTETMPITFSEKGCIDNSCCA